MIQKMIFYVISVISLMLISGCQENPDIIWNDVPKNMMILYLEERGLKKGIESPPYGDIVLLNTSDNKKAKITDDFYYDTMPYFSNGGDSIIFQSNRIGDQTVNSIIGIAGPFDLYIHRISNKLISKHGIIYETERKFEYRSTLYDLQLLNNRSVVFLKAAENVIYTSIIDQDSTKILKEFSEYISIDNISCKDSVIIYVYTKEKFVHRGVAMYNLRDNKVIEIANEDWRLGGWSKDGRKILLSNSNVIAEFDIVNRKMKEIVKFTKDDKLSIKDPIYASDTDIIFIGSEIKTYNENGYAESYGQTDIYLFKADRRSLSRLTKDGKDKNQLKGYLF